MRVLVIGATGAIGGHLVPQLRARGHEVIGTSRSAGKVERLRALGAEPIVLDVLDATATREAIAATRPDAIVYQATALAGLSDFKHFDRSFAPTNRLRTEGTDILLAAAAATILALEHEGPAIYNIVDDEPAPTRVWLPELAAIVGAKPPRRFPRQLARLVAGEAPVVMATESRGASNAKAKRELGWTLHYPSWRQGFQAAYGQPDSITAAYGQATPLVRIE